MIREEADFLLVSVLWGIGLTVLYDCLRIGRVAVRHASWAVSIEDFFYWIIAGFALFYLLFSMNDGNIRWFALAGAAAGMWLYHITISPFLVKILGTGLKYVLKGLLWPVKTIGHLLKKRVKWLTIKIRMSVKKRRQRRQEKKKDRGEKDGRTQKKRTKQRRETLQEAEQKSHRRNPVGHGIAGRRGNIPDKGTAGKG